MDENAIRQLVKLLEMANGLQEQSPSVRGSQYSALATMQHTPDQFLGPLGDLAAKMIPGLGVRGINGNMSPVFRTNMNFRNTGMSGFMNGIMNQNSAVHGAALRTQQNYQDAAWGKMFGENSAIQQTIDAKGKDGKYVIKSGADRDRYHAMVSLLGSPMLAAQGGEFVNSLLGYDRGVSSNMMNAASFNMAAGYKGGSRFSDNGSGGLNMHLTDPFSRDFQDTRSSLATLGTAGVQSMMYDGMLKKANMHGASEAMVSDIVSNAIANGQMDKMFGEGGIVVTNGDGTAMKFGNFQQVVDEQKNIDRQMDSTAARKEEAQEKLKEAQKRKDKSAIKDLEQQIKGFDQEMSDLGKRAKALGDAVGKAAEPLVEAVTGVVSSMKDFYGSEEEARRALDALTGGRGETDQATAERVHKQMDEIKMLSMSAGIDPSVMGKHLENVSDAFSKSSGRGSHLADGSGYNGQMALQLTRLFAGQMGAAAGDPRKQAQLFNAQQGYAESAGASRGNDFATMLVAAKKSGKFKGREEDYERLKKLAQTGRVADFELAFKQLKEIGWGSEEAGEAFRNDRSLMAMTRADFEGSEEEEAGALFANMHQQELARMGVESAYGAANTKQRRALAAAGLDMESVEKNVGSADFDTIMRSLAGVRGDEGASVARETMQRDYEAELKRNGGDAAAAKRAVAEKYHSEYAQTFLSSETRDKIKDASNNAVADAYMGENYFKDKNGNNITLRAEGFLKDIGAAGSDGRLTKTALSQATSNLMGYAADHDLRDKNGNALDAAEVQRRKNEIDELIRAGKGDEAQAALSKWFGNLDENSQKQLKLAAGKNNKTYRTAETLDREAEESSYLDEMMQNSELAAKMTGMTDDQKLVYARYHKQLTAKISPEEKEKVMASMKKMEEEAAAQSKGAGESLVEALQTGDMSKFMEIFKNGNVTMEQFFDSIKKIIGVMGGVVVSDQEALDASTLSSAKSGVDRETFLSYNSVTSGQRLGMNDDATIKAYLEALRGGDVSDRDVKRYKEELNGARAGKKGGWFSTSSKERYKNALGIEDEMLGKSAKELEEKINGEKDPAKKQELEGQLAAVNAQRQTIAGHRQKISAQDRKSFADEAVAFKDAGKEEPKGKGSGKPGGVTDQVLMSLVNKIDLLVSTLRTKHADATED